MDQKDTGQINNASQGQAYSGQPQNSFYQKHAAVSVIVKKTEKITTAIYMVTDFIPESEPLRIHLRTLALSMISGTRKISARSSEPHYALADEVSRTIDETASLITLATTIGLISEMNAKILHTELEKVKGDIERHYGAKKVLVATHPGYANVILTDVMFDVPQPETYFPAPVQQQQPVIEHKGQENSKGQTKIDIGLKIARRNDVLNVVRNKGKVSIKDILTILKDSGEKTIQRELFALVKEGVLVKEGEKRWSTYRVAS